MIVYPWPEDLQNFFYNPQERGLQSDWATVFLGGGGRRTPLIIKKEDNNYKKAHDVAFLIYAAGASKDLASEEIFKIEKKLERLNNQLGPLFKKHICYNPHKVGAKTHCKRSYDNYENYDNDASRMQGNFKIATSCGELRGLIFSDYSEEENQLLKNDVEECRRILATQQQVRDEVAQQREGPTNTKRAVKGIVVDLLNSAYQNTLVLYGEGAGIPFFHQVLSTADETENISTLKFSSDFSSIEEFKLYADFSLKGEYGGIQEYDLVKNPTLVFWTNDLGIKLINFEIADDLGFRLIAKDIALSLHPIFGMRLVGDVFITHYDGVERKGVLKLEL